MFYVDVVVFFFFLLLNSLIPAAGLLFLAALFSLYGLNENLCKTMREDLGKRRLEV